MHSGGGGRALAVLAVTAIAHGTGSRLNKQPDRSMLSVLEHGVSAGLRGKAVSWPRRQWADKAKAQS